MLRYFEPFFSSSYPDAAEHNPEEECELPPLDDSNFQLVLPSGVTIGHRSLQRYYRQNLKPGKQIALVQQRRTSSQNVLQQYNALGWTGLTDRKMKSKTINFIKNKNFISFHFKVENFDTAAKIEQISAGI